MLRILPLASGFHEPAGIRVTVERLSRELEGRGLGHRMIQEGAPDLLLIVTGGTEHLALQAAEAIAGPLILLAHPDQNSLPACLEILARLRQDGRAGRIVLLNDREAGFDELRRLARLLECRERMASSRLGRIGDPSDWLVASQPSAEAVQSWGPELVDVPMDAFREALDRADARTTSRIQEDFTSRARGIREPQREDLLQASRVAAALREIVEVHRLDACSLRCFDLVQERGTTGCLALSLLLDEGPVAGCEGDVPAALTMLWMSLLAGRPAFMANPQDLDPSAGTLWLAHCTVPRRMLRDYILRSHFESGLGVGIQGTLEPGPATLARIGGRDLRACFISDGEILENGESESRCRTQVRVRLLEDLRPLFQAPLGNHHVLLQGHWAEALREYHELFIA